MSGSIRQRMFLVVAIGLIPRPGTAQLPQRLVIRADLAALDPSQSQGIHLAWDAGAGLQITPHSYVLLDVARQNLNDELGGESTFWQTYLGASWEHAFGSSELYRRQLMVTARAGVLVRPRPYDDAPYLALGIGLRYPVAPWIHFQARLEDDLDLPRGQTLQFCIAPGYCSPFRTGGHLEHNLGLFLGAEIHG